MVSPLDEPVGREEGIQVLVGALAVGFPNVALRSAEALIAGCQRIEPRLSRELLLRAIRSGAAVGLGDAAPGGKPGASGSGPALAAVGAAERVLLTRQLFVALVAHAVSKAADAGAAGSSATATASFAFLAAAWAGLAEPVRQQFAAAMEPLVAHLAAEQLRLGRPLAERDVVEALAGITLPGPASTAQSVLEVLTVLPPEVHTATHAAMAAVRACEVAMGAGVLGAIKPIKGAKAPKEAKAPKAPKATKTAG
ncbi:hypothetical protein TSOC_012017 [Tetrabaena socialis]|uniref:Uncharacterized protein n=1 Tax=Tetrabaena socialis TaxID=47790 RepID=A0A2J7ZP30_9CHLO|nr:hypothetical protein TSOC_012017 [Tetrabaena socialis]|eukprot:PNH02021.1 hypothetical protein TSOC_012017 [Tetrabaena socialis]